MQSGTVNAPWSYMTFDTAKANSLAVIDYVECDSKQVPCFYATWSYQQQ
jgi:hypothetical protein